MKRVSTVVLALLVASALTACGDDEGSSGEAVRYAQEANAVCSRVSTELNEHFEEGEFPVVRSQIQGFVAMLAPIVTKGMDDIEALEPPAGDEGKTLRLRRAAGLLGGRFEEAAKDEARALKLFEEEGGFDGFRKAAKDYGGLAACERIGEEEEGDAEGAGKVDPTTLSKEKQAYIEKVDAICMKADQEDDKIDEEVFSQGFPPSVETWAKGLPQFAAVGRGRLVEIKDVEPPDADKATVDALIAEQEAILAELEEAGRVAGTGDEQAVIPSLQKLFTRFDEFDAKLRQFGFQVCGSEDEDEEE